MQRLQLQESELYITSVYTYVNVYTRMWREDDSCKKARKMCIHIFQHYKENREGNQRITKTETITRKHLEGRDLSCIIIVI